MQDTLSHGRVEEVTEHKTKGLGSLEDEHHHRHNTSATGSQDEEVSPGTTRHEAPPAVAIHERPRYIGQTIPSGYHNSLALEGYFPLQHSTGRSVSHRPSTMGPLGPTQSSSGSLQALSEHEGEDTTIQRAKSTRSTLSRGRSISHSKVSSISQPPPKRLPYADHAFYPDQSYAQLSSPTAGSRPYPMLRSRSSHPAQNRLYEEMSTPRMNLAPGRKTADNTPMSSPGLFTPQAVRQATADSTRAASPSLHHLQAPKETHTAEIEHDVYSGNKFINNYEIVSELGRGEHGKVKLGRDIERANLVAIKIVPRYSTKRRLGKLGAPEDRTKREVAILKKARHGNVVSLLEVIDDPNKNKVYLILEYVDRGEIKWRKPAPREILSINNYRFDQEKHGAYMTTEPTDRDRHIARLAHTRHDKFEVLRSKHADVSPNPNWSLEYAGETDEESDMTDVSRSVSRQLTNPSVPSRAGSQDDYVSANEAALGSNCGSSMYGPFSPEFYRARKFSIAASAISHMSSDVGYEPDDDQHSYVPALSLEETRRAFRDTLVGLEFLHFIGIIHRDIKPANLLSSSHGMVKISDFGVSYLGRPTTDEEAEKSGTDVTPLDSEKELARSVGTPAFWAPELCYEDCAIFEDGKEPKITGALDLWALGITLYCMIYARLPFYNDHEMGLHEAVCTAPVFCPRTRLVPVDTTSAAFVTTSSVPIHSHKRLDFELRYETVPDSVRDLIGQLLTKDPAQRISIAEAKRHAWVVEGLSNESEWLQGPIEKEGKNKILDINEKELSHAVVKRNIIERALTTASRIAGNLLGRKDSRKRASSTATSAGSSSESLYSPTGSTASTIGKHDRGREARRTSLRGDEFVQLLKASREPTDHHPLAQSQTASPEAKELQPHEYFAPATISVTSAPPSAARDPDDAESRPKGPDRAMSSLSTAESVKTVRASQFQRALASTPGDLDHSLDTSFRTRVEGLWEGTARTLHRFSSRERMTSRPTRSVSRSPSEPGGRAEPSLAVSNTYAAGAISTPIAPMDDAVPPEIKSSSSGQLPELVRHTPFHAPVSSEEEYARAQELNQRRHLQEAKDLAELEASRPPLEELASPVTCPPSPDDELYSGRSGPSATEVSPSALNGGFQSTTSASTIASSMDNFCGSSMSDPSHGVASGASSPPEGFISAEYKDLQFASAPAADTDPEYLRTADTVTLHGGAGARFTAKALEEQQAFYDNDGDDEDDSDDEGIVMGGPARS